VIGEKVEEGGALFFVRELLGAREAVFMLSLVGDEIGWATGKIRCAVAAALGRVERERLRRVGELLLQGIGEENALGEFAD
jgi:hypothetical protein